MAHPDDSLWAAIFRKSPIVGVCMIVCAVIGLGTGFYYSYELAQFVRLFLCILVSCALGGGFVGLIVGVIADTLIGSRGDDKKKKPPRDRMTRL
jgi:hypothetical protein